MEYLKDSIFYQEAIQEINFPFGNYYLFENFFVAEINEGVVYTWKDHGKIVVEELSTLYDQNGKDLIYITNRVHSYPVMPSDWIKFYRNSYSLEAYAIVSYTPKGILNALLEKFFTLNKFKNFGNLTGAIVWAKNLSGMQENAA